MKSTTKNTDEGELWHWEGRVYRLINSQIVSYSRTERRKVDGHMVTVSLPPVRFTVCRAVLVGNEELKQLAEDHRSTE